MVIVVRGVDVISTVAYMLEETRHNTINRTVYTDKTRCVGRFSNLLANWLRSNNMYSDELLNRAIEAGDYREVIDDYCIYGLRIYDCKFIGDET